jgi:hypothetical protein
MGERRGKQTRTAKPQRLGQSAFAFDCGCERLMEPGLASGLSRQNWKYKMPKKSRKTAADKIIEGLKQAAKSAKCEHDWEFQSGAVWSGHMAITSFCAYCQCRKTEHFPVN